MLYIVVFGFPLAGVPLFSNLSRDSQLFWLAVLGFTLTYGAYVVGGLPVRASRASTGARRRRPARSACPTPQTLRYVVVPQAVRRIIPPLLNDFIGLQKDTALVSVVGVLDVVNRAAILKGQRLQPVLRHRRGDLLPRHHHPDDPAHRLAGRARPAPHAGQAAERWPFLEIDDVAQALRRRTRCCAGLDLDVDEHQVVCLIGPSGCGKSTLLRCINGLEAIEGGEIRSTASG